MSASILSFNNQRHHPYHRPSHLKVSTSISPKVSSISNKSTKSKPDPTEYLSSIDQSSNSNDTSPMDLFGLGSNHFYETPTNHFLGDEMEPTMLFDMKKESDFDDGSKDAWFALGCFEPDLEEHNLEKFRTGFDEIGIDWLDEDLKPLSVTNAIETSSSLDDGRNEYNTHRQHYYYHDHSGSSWMDTEEENEKKDIASCSASSTSSFCSFEATTTTQQLTASRCAVKHLSSASTSSPISGMYQNNVTSSCTNSDDELCSSTTNTKGFSLMNSSLPHLPSSHLLSNTNSLRLTDTSSSSINSNTTAATTTASLSSSSASSAAASSTTTTRYKLSWSTSSPSSSTTAVVTLTDTSSNSTNASKRQHPRRPMRLHESERLEAAVAATSCHLQPTLIGGTRCYGDSDEFCDDDDDDVNSLWMEHNSVASAVAAVAATAATTTTATSTKSRLITHCMNSNNATTVHHHHSLIQQQQQQQQQPSNTSHSQHMTNHISNGESRLRLLEYVVHLLNTSDPCVRWVHREKRVFQIMDPSRLSYLWGYYKRNAPLTFNSVCRSLRLYYKDGTIKRLENKRDTYQILKDG